MRSIQEVVHKGCESIGADRKKSAETPKRVISHSAMHPRVRLLATVLFVSGFLAGCQSAPVRAWQGARHFAAGDAALDQKDPQTAIRELTLAAKLVPHASEIRNHLGLAYWQAGEEIAATRAFEAALEIDCDNQAARLNLDRLLEESALLPPPRPERVGDENDGR